jgi:uncharacterized membrane protein
MSFISSFIDWIATGFDVAGVLVILCGTLYAAARQLSPARRRNEPYRLFRREVGHATLLGLELLLAAEIIRTVAINRSIENAFELGLIVLIRTFLSVALEVELEGRWPWRRAAQAGAGESTDPGPQR